MAFKKEINYYHRNFSRGIKWYKAHFPINFGKTRFISGEATPLYFYHPLAPSRISENYPNIKIIIILRNPVDRTISHYKHAKRNGFVPNDFSGAIEKCIQLKSDYLQEASIKRLEGSVSTSEISPGEFIIFWSQYIFFIKNWLQTFNKENILIIKSEELFEKPKFIMKKVYNYLELSPFSSQEYKNYNMGQNEYIGVNDRKALEIYFKEYNLQLEDYLKIHFNW
jgi:hypothetical protein